VGVLGVSGSVGVEAVEMENVEGGGLMRSGVVVEAVSAEAGREKMVCVRVLQESVGFLEGLLVLSMSVWMLRLVLDDLTRSAARSY